MPYCTVFDVVEFLGNQGVDPARVRLLLTPVIEAIENNYRSFVPVTQTRVFDYKDTREVKVDRDLVSVTAITTTAGQSFDADDCTLEPRSGPPYRWIRMKSGRNLYYSNEMYGAISVAGSWGYAGEVPQAVQMAIKTWVGILYNQLDTLGFESVRGGEITATLKKLTATIPDEVKVWLEPFRPVRILSVGT